MKNNKLSRYIEERLVKLNGNIEQRLHKVNLVLSAGGMCGMYQAGITGFLLNKRQNKIQIHKIYGVSAGSCAGAFFIFMEQPTSNFSIDDFVKLVDTNLRNEYEKEKHYITNAWRNVMKEIFPDDIHIHCNGRLHIAIHCLERNGRIVRKVINCYKSKDHLIDVIHTSMSVPLVTIPEFVKKYKCPFTNQTLYAFDGMIVPEIIDDEDKKFPCLVADLHRHTYPFLKRLYLSESSYDFLVLDGIDDIHRLLSDGKSLPSLYFQKTEKISNHTTLFRMTMVAVFLLFSLLRSLIRVKF